MDDVLILGAGVVGLSAAKHLAHRGAKVTVLDAKSPGGVSSRAAAGVAIPSFRLFDDLELLSFCQAAQPVPSEELASVGGSSLKRGSGILRLVPDAAARSSMETKSSQAPEFLGRWVDADELLTLEPCLRGGTVYGAFLQQDAFVVDTESYLNGLLAQCAAAGVTLKFSEPALAVNESPSRVEVQTPYGALQAGQLLVATGAWSGTVPGLRPLPIKPQRGQMMTVFHPTLRLKHVVSGASYLAPWRYGEIVVGATEEDAGFYDHPTPAGLLHLSAVLARLSPALREARFVRAWAGLRSLAPSGRPLLGAYPGNTRVFLATGHAGQGILTGGLSGKAMAERMATGASPMLEPFEPKL